jgi:hypothetical protein
VTVTRHGATIGYFIPVRATRRDLDRAALKEAAIQMDAMLKGAHFTADEIGDISKEFRLWRKTSRK